ncbi:MAG TPA: hypothetical protein VIT20_04620 [Propionibacteriaceae bacterium]
MSPDLAPTRTAAAGTGPVSAPPAPGRMGSPVDPQATLVYLEALGRWRDDRRRELDQLDQTALSAPVQTGAAAVTSDIMLSMALWKAASDRYELLLRTWDSGRVGTVERERLATLIWGRLDATLDPALISRSTVPGNAALAVSLPEACRLSDALAAQLRVRLGLQESGQEITERLRQLRAQLERIRDQVDLEPAGSAQQEAAGVSSRLARRLKDLADKSGRGGDIGGLLGPLEIESAVFERDLIVNGARRREAGALVGRGRAQRAALEVREEQLRTLAAECVATVAPAPRFAVPDVDALGPLPNTPDALKAYLHRLDQVARAMTIAQDAYAAALADHHELVSRLDAFHAKARATGAADRPDVAQAYELAHRTLAARPCRMELARQLVTLYQTYLQLETS